MTPYMGLFDFKPDQSYNGTIFRLPFRSRRQGISDVVFDKEEVTKLQDGVRKEGSKLLLFLQNVNCITFSKIEKDQRSPQILLQVKKNGSQERHKLQPGEHICLSAGEFEVCTANFQDDTFSKEHWLIAESRDIQNSRVGAVACLLEKQSHDVYSPRCVHGEAFCFLPLHNSLKTGLPVHVSGNFSLSNDRKAIHSSDGASANELCEFNVSLMKTSIPHAYHKLLLFIQELCIKGKVSIHDYAFHSLWPVRGSLKTQNPWKHFIPKLYQLVSGSQLCYSETMGEWRSPARCKLLPEDNLQRAQREDVKKVVVSLEHPLIELPIECRAHLKESEGCLSTISEPQFLEEFFEHIDYFPIATRNNVLLSLIITYAKECTHVKEKDGNSFVEGCDEMTDDENTLDSPLSELSFYYDNENSIMLDSPVQLTFQDDDEMADPMPDSFLPQLSFQDDNEIGFGSIPDSPVSQKINGSMTLKSSVLQLPRYENLRKFIGTNRCIPCSLDGEKLRECCDIVDHRSNELAPLYEPWEERFVVDSFRVPIVEGALQELGMISSAKRFPWAMIIERAKTVNVVYKKDRIKALERTRLLLRCIEEKQSVFDSNTQLLSPEELFRIPFLPVLQKPQDYPQELLWKGSGHDLLSASKVLVYSSKFRSLHLVAGSTSCIVSNEAPPKGGCGRISDELASSMNISLLPSISDVLNQLENIAEMKASYSKDFSTWISIACKEIYRYVEMDLESSDMSTMRDKFKSHPGLVWTGSEFINPSSIALEWHHNGPYLYCPPSLLSSRFCYKLLDLKERFGIQQILDALENFKKAHDNESIPRDEREAVLAAVLALAGSMEEDCIKLDPNYTCYLPDEKFCMRELQELAWNDAPWCKPDQKVVFVCDSIPRPIALKLGVKPLRSVALDRYISSLTNQFSGIPFGQHEDLTQRIKNILDTYIDNETVLKELLQNADDAEATQLYFILDKRTHGIKRLPCDDWEDLQGPALLVWNNQGFSKEDFAGIKDLGLGSKRSKSESIGQFGIGFNVVYHLTDCPSFFTNGSTLCVFDPHLRYAPGATLEHPGRQWDNLDKQFWDNWSDLKSVYLQEGLRCPDEMSTGGTLFRFPLRSTDQLVKNSKLVDYMDYVPYTASMMEEKLDKWAPLMKESLLFLKHVKEINFCVINEGATSMTTSHHFKAEVGPDAIEDLNTFQSQCKKFSSKYAEPHVVSYSLRLMEKMVCAARHWRH